jgi:hypothetical protein
VDKSGTVVDSCEHDNEPSGSIGRVISCSDEGQLDFEGLNSMELSHLVPQVYKLPRANPFFHKFTLIVDTTPSSC